MISLVTSVYNKGPWLERFLTQIHNQSFRDYEFIIVDNASTDESSEIIKKYAIKDQRINVIPLENNIGPSGGLRVGLEHASGEYFTLLDADDFVDLNYLEVLYSKAKQYDADISMCVNDMVWEDGRIEHKPWSNSSTIIIEGEEVKKLPCQLLDELNDVYFGEHIPEIGAQWAKLVRTSIIREHGIEHDPMIWTWNDWVFNMKIIKHVKRFVYTKDTVYHFFQDNESVTRVSSLSPLYKDRFLYAIQKMHEATNDIMFPELERALNVFRFRIIQYVYGYYRSFFPIQLDRKEMLSIIHEISNNKEFKELIASDYIKELNNSDIKLLRRINDYKRLYLYLVYIFLKFKLTNLKGKFRK